MSRSIKQRRRQRHERRRAVVLIVVLVVIVMLSLSAYSYTAVMVAQRESAMLMGRQIKTRALVDSGVEAIKMFLAQDEQTKTDLGGVYDNPTAFQGVLVINDEDPSFRGHFAVTSPALDDVGMLTGIRFGLLDESSRLNLNALMLAEAQTQVPGDLAGAIGEGVSGNGESGGNSGSGAGGGGTTGGSTSGGSSTSGGGTTSGDSTSSGGESESGDEMAALSGGRQLLMALPGMDVETADAILDWIDEDDDPREFGAEVDYYSSLNPPYAPKNGPLESVEELLLVRGVLPQLLFGFDVNRNGMIDQQEKSDAATAMLDSIGIDNSTGALDLGWSAYLTLYSQEKNQTLDGQPRVFVNGDDMQVLYDEIAAAIDDEWATFIVAYRQNGPYTGNDDGELAQGELDLEKEGKVPLVQVLDLVDAKVQVRFKEARSSTVLASPVQLATLGLTLPVLMDRLTVNPSPVIPGRININQAPAAILAGIPGLPEEAVSEILSRRDIVPDDEDPNRRHETWLLAEAICDLDTMRTILPYVNVGGDVFRAQVVGYFEDGGATSRAEVVFDATQPLPRILFWRDISHLGTGYSLETLGVGFTE